MSFKCDRHGLDFNSNEELQDHIVKTHPLPENSNNKQIKRALDKNAKSKERIIGGINRGLKKSIK